MSLVQSAALRALAIPELVLLVLSSGELNQDELTQTALVNREFARQSQQVVHEDVDLLREDDTCSAYLARHARLLTTIASRRDLAKRVKRITLATQLKWELPVGRLVPLPVEPSITLLELTSPVEVNLFGVTERNADNWLNALGRIAKNIKSLSLTATVGAVEANEVEIHFETVADFFVAFTNLRQLTLRHMSFWALSEEETGEKPKFQLESLTIDGYDDDEPPSLEHITWFCTSSTATLKELTFDQCPTDVLVYIKDNFTALEEFAYRISLEELVPQLFAVLLELAKLPSMRRLDLEISQEYFWDFTTHEEDMFEEFEKKRKALNAERGFNVLDWAQDD